MGGIQRTIPHFWQNNHLGSSVDFMIDFLGGKYSVQEKLDGIAISLHWNAEMQDWWVIRSKKHLKELAPTQCLKRLWANEYNTPKENRTFLLRDVELTDLLIDWCVQFEATGGLELFRRGFLNKDVTLHFEVINLDYRVFVNYQYDQFVYLGNTGLLDYEDGAFRHWLDTTNPRNITQAVEIPGIDLRALLPSIVPKIGEFPDVDYKTGRHIMEISGLDTLLEYVKVLYLHTYPDRFIRKADTPTIVPLMSGYEGLIVHTPEGKVKITGEFTPKFMEIRENLWKLRGRN